MNNEVNRVESGSGRKIKVRRIGHMYRVRLRRVGHMYRIRLRRVGHMYRIKNGSKSQSKAEF